MSRVLTASEKCPECGDKAIVIVTSDEWKLVCDTCLYEEIREPRTFTPGVAALPGTAE